MRPAQCVAHRGYQKHFPENTLLAVREAIAAGALHVEVDVQLSRDAVPVVYHDETLARLSDRKGRVSDYPVAELVCFPAHEPGRFGQRFADEKIATLAALVECIRENPAVTFYIELKEEAVKTHGADTCLRQIADVLQPVLAQCCLISFDLAALGEARRLGFHRLGPVIRDWARRDEIARTLGASVLFINKTRIPAGVIVAPCPVVVYEIADPAEASQWLQRGAAMVETFAVGEMLGK